MDAELVAVLTEETHLPAEALKRAARNPETVAEPVLALLERAAEDADAIEDEETNLLFWGLHALAAARDTRKSEFQPQGSRPSPRQRIRRRDRRLGPGRHAAWKERYGAEQ